MALPTDHVQRRACMVHRQIAARGVRDPAVLQAMRTVPRPLLQQLAVRRRLVIPAGRATQKLLRVRRTAHEALAAEDLGDVRFVPLVGEDRRQP
jgi:protein-L-isoaspartate O-methyltransferase